MTELETFEWLDTTVTAIGRLRRPDADERSAIPHIDP